MAPHKGPDELRRQMHPPGRDHGRAVWPRGFVRWREGGVAWMRQVMPARRLAAGFQGDKNRGGEMARLRRVRGAELCREGFLALEHREFDRDAVVEMTHDTAAGGPERDRDADRGLDVQFDRRAG